MNSENVTRCPEGVAEGAFHLRSRGFELLAEVTCWPRYETTRYKLTTGGHEPCRLKPMAHEDYELAVQEFYAKYGTKAGAVEETFTRWMERWRKEAKMHQRISIRKAKRGKVYRRWGIGGVA